MLTACSSVIQTGTSMQKLAGLWDPAAPDGCTALGKLNIDLFRDAHSGCQPKTKPRASHKVNRSALRCTFCFCLAALRKSNMNSR